jgi:hypothetical protein
MITVPNTKYQWIAFELYQKALVWCRRMRRRMRTASEYSSWWFFIWYWGALKGGFHFLGVNFEVSRNPQRQTQVTTVDIHDRTCRRALDKVQAMSADAVNPAKIQRYLSLWASWWCSVTKLERFALIYRWVSFTGRFQQGWVVARTSY